MAQQLATDFPIDAPTTSGTALADILNRFADSVNTSNSGATAPVDTFPGMLWFDTSATPPVMRTRNAANTGWNSIPMSSGASGSPFLLPDGTVIAPGLAWNSEPGMGWYRSGAGGRNFVEGGIKVESLDTSVATTTNLALFPRAAGIGALALWNAPATATDANGIGFQSNNTTGYSIFESLKGAAPAKPLSLSFPAGVVVSNDFKVGSVTLTAGQTLWNQDANTVFLAMAANWFWSYTKATNVLAWTHGTSGRSTTFRANGDFASGGNVFCNPAVNNGYPALNGATSGFPNLQFTADNWRLQFVAANGSLQYVNQSNGVVYNFQGNGDPTKSTGAGQWSGPSDIRLKTNVAPLAYGLDEILQLEPITFDMGGATRRVGLSAQAAEPVMPMMVYKTRNEDPTIELDEVYGLNPDFVEYALVNAVKTLHERISQLEGAPAP